MDFHVSVCAAVEESLGVNKIVESHKNHGRFFFVRVKVFYDTLGQQVAPVEIGVLLEYEREREKEREKEKERKRERERERERENSEKCEEKRKMKMQKKKIFKGRHR